MPNDVPLEASTQYQEADKIHTEPRPNSTEETSAEVLGDRSLLNHMVRRPTEEDFEDVLTPEGNASGDIVGSDVTDGIGPSNDSLGGLG
jgi:hypothetical protein